MKPIMTATHIARLKQDVQNFLNSRGNPTKVEVANHISELGWNTVDRQMFYEWLQENFGNAFANDGL